MDSSCLRTGEVTVVDIVLIVAIGVIAVTVAIIVAMVAMRESSRMDRASPQSV